MPDEIKTKKASLGVVGKNSNAAHFFDSGGIVRKIAGSAEEFCIDTDDDMVVFDRPQAEALRNHLTAWLETGRLEVE